MRARGGGGHEAGRWVGGQVLLAQRLPGRAESGGVATNLQGEAMRAGVRILTGSRVDASLIEREVPDVVIVATGAMPHRPGLELVGDPPVFDAWEVIRGAKVPVGRVVVVDWRCDWIGQDAAALVLAAGHVADSTLYDELTARPDLRSAAGLPIEVHGIGDCLAPRTVEEAVLEGLRVASAI